LDKVNVLIVSQMDMEADFNRKVAAVDPRINVIDGTRQFLDELKRAGRTGQFVDILEKSARLAPEPTRSLDELLAEAEVVFGVVLFPDNMKSRAKKLKWLQIAATGIDRYKPMGFFDGSIIVTNSRGTQAIPIAEFVLGYIFMFAKNARGLFESQRIKRWDAFVSLELRDKTMGLIGTGAIGGEITRLAKGIGMRVIATKKSAVKREMNIAGIDELYPLSQLHQLLADSDYVVLAVPGTPETVKMIGEAELRAMKPTAYLINIARGEVVDQAALIKVLKESRIAGAGLDVFEKEPLPSDSELWNLHNVILSAHATGNSGERNRRVADLFCENLRRYVNGEPLLNVIDIKKGY